MQGQPETMEQTIEQPRSMERALEQTERTADTALKAAERLVNGLRQLKHAAQQGEMRKLHGSADALRQSIAVLQQEVENAAASWTFDEEGYLRDGRYAQELLRQAQARKVQMTEQDDRLYVPPMLITVDPARRAVRIDRKVERRIRPSMLIDVLQERQLRPVRFKPARFLETLYTAYQAVVAQEGRDAGAVVRLVRIYALLTIMPDVARDYALPEFTRDIHLLDISGENTTKSGAVVHFNASTGTRSGRDVLSIVTSNGAEKRYYGVAFGNANPHGD